MLKKTVIREVEDERRDQDYKWGQQDHNLVEWMTILTEEVGEAAKEACDYHFNNPPKKFTCLSQDDIQKKRLAAYRKELIQTAAVAIAMVESLDRNEIGK